MTDALETAGGTPRQPGIGIATPGVADYRFERKAFIRDLGFHQVLALVKTHRANFREVFWQREINNLYFDTVDLRNYWSNVEGDQDRRKARIRWYGEMLGEISKPTLELKIRSNAMGRKEHYPLHPFALERGFDMRTVADALAASALPPRVALFVAAQEGKLLNRYTRRYFLSGCGRFRITLDRDMVFHGIRAHGNRLLHLQRDHRSLILEIKYDAEHDRAADEIAARFPFLMTKSSKYAYGIDRLWQ